MIVATTSREVLEVFADAGARNAAPTRIIEATTKTGADRKAIPEGCTLAPHPTRATKDWSAYVAQRMQKTDNPNACHLWVGAARVSLEYKTRVLPNGRRQKYDITSLEFRRLVWMVVHGTLPKAKVWVTCKETWCCNPRHMVEGRPKGAPKPMKKGKHGEISKRRLKGGSGPANPIHGQTTPQQDAEIRRASHARLAQYAADALQDTPPFTRELDRIAKADTPPPSWETHPFPGSTTEPNRFGKLTSAVEAIVAALQPLEPEARGRVLAAVQILLG